MSNIRISNKEQALEAMEILIDNGVVFTPSYEQDLLNGGYRIHLQYTDNKLDYVQVTPGNWPFEMIRSSVEKETDSWRQA